MDCLVAIDRFDDLIHNAKAVPLSDDVRIDQRELNEEIENFLAALPREMSDRPDVDAHLRLAELVRNARPVPLTGQVRIHKETAYELLDQLRAVLPEVMKGVKPFTGATKTFMDAIDALDKLVDDSRGLFTSSAKIDAAQLRAAMDELHAAATTDIRRLDREGALDELDRLATNADPARGDRVRVPAAPVQRALDRLRNVGFEYHTAG